MTRNTIQRAMAGLTAGLLTVVAIAAPGLVGFRCEAMETVHDRPCCRDVFSGGEARLSSNCCTLEVRDGGQALAAWESRVPDLQATFIVVLADALALAEALPVLGPLVRETGPSPGPPLRLRNCSLQI